MARITGYDGGDGEEQLLAALKQGVATESDDAWGRIREKDMYIGSIVDICVSKGYVKASRLGFAGYFVTKVGYAETYIRQCWHVWQKRRDFDAVREWVTNSNTFKKPVEAVGSAAVSGRAQGLVGATEPQRETEEEAKEAVGEGVASASASLPQHARPGWR